MRKLSTTSPDRAGGIGGTGCLLVPLMLSCLLLASGCITDDIATIIDIFDPDHGGSPDLAIEEISYLPREPEVGGSITVSVRIRNSGRMRSQETTVSLMVGDAEVSVAQLPRLQGSETITVEFPGSLVLPVGMSVLKGIANPEREGEESRWHNNVAATTILVGEPSFERTFTWEYALMPFSDHEAEGEMIAAGHAFAFPTRLYRVHGQGRGSVSQLGLVSIDNKKVYASAIRPLPDGGLEVRLVNASKKEQLVKLAWGRWWKDPRPVNMKGDSIECSGFEAEKTKARVRLKPGEIMTLWLSSKK